VTPTNLHPCSPVAACSNNSAPNCPGPNGAPRSGASRHPGTRAGRRLHPSPRASEPRRGSWTTTVISIVDLSGSLRDDAAVAGAAPSEPADTCCGSAAVLPIAIRSPARTKPGRVDVSTPRGADTFAGVWLRECRMVG
jgi:hypothetical protein